MHVGLVTWVVSCQGIDHGINVIAFAANGDPDSDGFIEGSTLSLINRNYYFNRDFRDGESATGNGYSEEWAHGLMAFFESGYTQGSVGIGVDAFAMLGLKLDSGSGRSGAGGSIDLLPHTGGGRGESTLAGHRDQGRRCISRYSRRALW